MKGHGAVHHSFTLPSNITFEIKKKGSICPTRYKIYVFYAIYLEGNISPHTENILHN